MRPRLPVPGPPPGEVVESFPALVGSVAGRVVARGSDLTALDGVRGAQTQRWAVVIDQAEDLRRSLVRDRDHVSVLLTGLIVARRALVPRCRPGVAGTQDRSARVQAAIWGAATIVRSVDAAVHALRPLAQSLVEDLHLPATADRSVRACRWRLGVAQQAAGELVDDLGVLSRLPWVTEPVVDPSQAAAGP